MRETSMLVTMKLELIGGTNLLSTPAARSALRGALRVALTPLDVIVRLTSTGQRPQSRDCLPPAAPVPGVRRSLLSVGSALHPADSPAAAAFGDATMDADASAPSATLGDAYAPSPTGASICEPKSHLPATYADLAILPTAAGQALDYDAIYLKVCPAQSGGLFRQHKLAAWWSRSGKEVHIGFQVAQSQGDT